MNEKFIKISALLLCIVLLLSGCASKATVNDADNYTDFNESDKQTSSEVNSEDAISENSSSRDTSSRENEKPKNTDKTKPDEDNSDEETQPEIFDLPSVQGGTVIGTTSKGYKITEKNGVTYINNVLIVNKTYSLPESYKPGLQALCNKAFNKMKAAAKKDGISIWISSGYRSFKSQKNLYESYCNRDGVIVADRYSARPGHSEHQSGWAIDVNSASTAAYETIYKQVGEWLKEHCFEYGFIIRYPEGKEGLTGYKHEPWHIRYVGTELALQLKENGLTLEEYFGITSCYSSAGSDEENESTSEKPESGESSSEDNESNASSSQYQENNESDCESDETLE